MDIIFYPAVTIILWVLSISLLGPFVLFLKFNNTYRDKWFSWFFVRIIMPMFDEEVKKIRKRSFDHLNELANRKKKNSPLEILEIGIGGGGNLPFYPENSNLTVLDKNESFIKYFEENRQKYAQVTYKKTVIGTIEDMQEIDDCSFDVVVCTYVLCYAQRVEVALKEIKRVLKPGGKFLFVLHTTYPSFTWKFVLQYLINPLWKIGFNGCSLINKDYEEIKKAEFSEVTTEKFYQDDLWLFVRPHVIGVATK